MCGRTTGGQSNSFDSFNSADSVRPRVELFTSDMSGIATRYGGNERGSEHNKRIRIRIRGERITNIYDAALDAGKRNHRQFHAATSLSGSVERKKNNSP